MRALAVSSLLFTAQILLGAGMLWGALVSTAAAAPAQNRCAEWLPALHAPAAPPRRTVPHLILVQDILPALPASCRQKKLVAAPCPQGDGSVVVSGARSTRTRETAVARLRPTPRWLRFLTYPGFGFRALAPPPRAGAQSMVQAAAPGAGIPLLS